jgi:SH3-like domain-containing protein
METKRHLIFILFILSLVLLALSLPIPAAAAETADYEVVPCQEPEGGKYETCMHAWVFDTDPAGLNVREGPGTEYPVITTLPTDRVVVVTISGSVGEWIRIKDARVCPGTGEMKDVHLDLVGWVHGTLLKVMVLGGWDQPSWPFSSEPAPLYAEPNDASSIIARIPNNTNVTVAGCRAGWMKVRYRELEGWLSPASRGTIEMDRMCYLVITALEGNDAGRPGLQNVSSPGPR